MTNYFGIDKRVISDQINGQLPGGSLELVSPDMISGGSVESGASLLGSLDAASSGGGDEAPVEPAE